MSNQTHSQDSVSDPRNEDDYDTWEYGTEPVPGDSTWKRESDSEFEKIWEEMDDIEPLTPKQKDVNQSIEAYKEAARSDRYMFGDYDAYQAYGDVPD